jgi:hypothetical protein
MVNFGIVEAGIGLTSAQRLPLVVVELLFWP